MDFKDTLQYMYDLLPMYQRVGAVAFKKDLTNTLQLCEVLGNPQKAFKSIHVAGTNGKGSSAHMLASVLQSAGYKTGLYTSPHLKSFTERIKIDGEEVSEAFVVDFIKKLQKSIEELQPSFFEITVVMAFEYFARQNVDVAVIEVGLGGRLDSTNVIIPLVSLITNIGLDHTDMLGETLPEIAGEKAGIIKPGIPVVISETQPEITYVFDQRAKELGADIYYADQIVNIFRIGEGNGNLDFEVISANESFVGKTDLVGKYQLKNIAGVLQTLEIIKQNGFDLSQEKVVDGLSNVVKNTGLLGRWQRIGKDPLTICDTVHNSAGIQFFVDQIHNMSYKNLIIIWGSVMGKNLDGIWKLLPKNAFYYFCEAKVPRAMKAEELQKKAMDFQCFGEVVHDVNDALARARTKADKEDLILIGGSNFIIAEINELKA